MINLVNGQIQFLSLMSAQRYQSFREFYPHYLSEHSRKGTRVLHFIGTTGFLIFVLAAFISAFWWFLLAGVVFAYGLAWVGHFFIEKNKPATFQYPLWSLMSDFKLYFEIITGKENFGE